MDYTLRQIISKTLLTLILLAGSLSYGQVSNNFPENVRQSFAWGITDNNVLTRTDLEIIAQAVVEKTYGLTTEAAKARVKELSVSGLRKVSTESFMVDYVELSIRELERLGKANVLVSQFMGSETLNSPIRFQRNGESFIRWFIHPLRKDLSFLEKLGNPKIESGQFLAQMTESRSLLIMERASGHYWTIKLSLPVSVGPFKDKTYLSHQAEIQFKSSEYLLEQQKNSVYRDTQFLHEQEAFSFKSNDINEGQLVRSLAILKKGGYLLPYSSIYSNGLSRYLAPARSQQHFVTQEKRWLGQEPGFAAANLYAGDGLIVNSNHSQNSLLLLSAEREAVKYIRRDMDFDLDGDNFPNSKAKSFLSPKHIRTSGVNFSMTNGFAGKSYYQPLITNIVASFYASFLEQYKELKQKPTDFKIQASIIRIPGEDHYFLRTSGASSSAVVRTCGGIFL